MRQQPESDPPRSAIVIGGGISGLAAARALSSSGVDTITLLEGATRLGGKLRTTTVDGVGLELGADSFLAMKPQAIALAEDLGLDLVAPGPLASTTYVLRGGRLRPLPKGLAMGVPTGIAPLLGCVRDGIIGPFGALRAGLEPLMPASRGDRATATVAEVTRRRLGKQVADRLIAPLVGGVFGAPPDEVGFNDVFPQMASARSLVMAMARRPPQSPGTPTFLTPREGLQRMVDALHDDLRSRGVRIRLGPDHLVRQVSRDGAGTATFTVTTVAGDLQADAVIVATPAPIAARILGDILPSTSQRHLADVRSHPSAVFLLRYPSGSLQRELDGGGYLVAPEDRATVAACTWLPTKWPHHPWMDPWIRAIVTDPGRLQDSDGDLTAAVAAEIGGTLGGPDPSDVILQRWEAAIPIYGPGHRQRMASVLESLPQGLALAGAAYRGPGIPDCIGTAQEAASRVPHMSGNPL